jgi:hypothetical protein
MVRLHTEELLRAAEQARLAGAVRPSGGPVTRLLRRVAALAVRPRRAARPASATPGPARGPVPVSYPGRRVRRAG